MLLFGVAVERLRRELDMSRQEAGFMLENAAKTGEVRATGSVDDGGSITPLEHKHWYPERAKFNTEDVDRLINLGLGRTTLTASLQPSGLSSPLAALRCSLATGR